MENVILDSSARVLNSKIRIAKNSLIFISIKENTPEESLLNE